jgi:hypothetical protein
MNRAVAESRARVAMTGRLRRRIKRDGPDLTLHIVRLGVSDTLQQVHNFPGCPFDN